MSRRRDWRQALATVVAEHGLDAVLGALAEIVGPANVRKRIRALHQDDRSRVLYGEALNVFLLVEKARPAFEAKYAASLQGRGTRDTKLCQFAFDKARRNGGLVQRGPMGRALRLTVRGVVASGPEGEHQIMSWENLRTLYKKGKAQHAAYRQFVDRIAAGSD